MRTRLLAAVALATFLVTPGVSRTHDLTFRDRVEAQRAIERVYYSHQTGAALPFETAVPEALLERKVRTSLKESAALESIWHTPITDEALKAEWKRIVQDTRFPHRLREISRALGDDTVLIKECFVRGVLADRLARGFFASDRRIHEKARLEIEDLRNRLVSGALDPAHDHPRRKVVEWRQSSGGKDLPVPAASQEIDSIALDEEEFRAREEQLGEEETIGEIEESREAFSLPIVLDKQPGRILAAVYQLDKETWDAWWSRVEGSLAEMSVRTVAEETEMAPLPSGSRSGTAPLPDTASISEEVQSANTGCIPADSWTRGLKGDLPDARGGHTAVWTGTEMIVWGGTGPSSSSEFKRGNRYDPLTDTWRDTSSVNAPTPRSKHTAVWTGSRMLVWGGAGINQVQALGSGARYDPIADTWSPISSAGAPSPRHSHTAVWTGSRMVVFGGYDGVAALGDGGQYDPVTDTWVAVTPPMFYISPRHDHTAVWTGTYMIVWGGSGGNPYPIRGDGARYNPATNQWFVMSGGPRFRLHHTAIWTGNRMIVYGGDDATGTVYSDGAQYDPVSNTWTTIASFGTGRTNHKAVWTGSRMLVWGGSATNTGGLFNPGNNSWQATSTVGAPSGRVNHSMIWTGDRAVIWGGGDNFNLKLRDGGRYDPQSDTWTPTSIQIDGPTARDQFGMVWTGNQMVVWGGRVFANGGGEAVTNTGGRYDPVTDTWTATSLTNVPAARQMHSTVWTGSRVVVWGGLIDLNNTATNTGGRYDPISDSWSPTSLSGAPGAREGARAVWTGDRAIFWGAGTFTPLNGDGWKYDPVADTWAALSTQNQPQARFSFSMLWTGSRVVIWGGTGSSGSLNTGGRYNPSNDHWFTTSTVNAPPPTSGHAAVWTGSSMIILGEAATPGTYSAGRYDPQGDTWSSMSTSGAPPAGFANPTVWTGTEMIVWAWASDQGGRYNPAFDSWAPMSSQGAPPSESISATAVWTGEFMLLWGNMVRSSLGGVYAPAQVSGDRDGDGFQACSGDCDDSDPSVHPGAAEFCNGHDDDCDGVLDDGFADGDGDGYAACGGDCNDAAASVHPAAPELCNGVDDNCNGVVDEEFTAFDLDGDGHPSCGASADCDDTRFSVYPGAVQVCDGINNDCSSPGWPAVPPSELDGDGDGSIACSECNDANPNVRPGGTQICDGLNNDCNSPSWPALTGTNETDDDADSYSECGGDCNDILGTVYPGAPQTCDGVNNDCFSPSYPDLAGTNEADDDFDGTSECAGDCNDANFAVRPGGAQVCDGLNNNCSAPGWPSLAGTNDGDDDGDGTTECAGDCNDASAAVRPGGTQVCDGLNNDCSAPGWPSTTGTNEGDDDGDGTSECQGDCDDTDATHHANAPEINDGEDNQCPSNFGYGAIDEISGIAGFSNPGNPGEFSWPPQSGASSYEAQRSSVPFPSSSPFLASTVTGAAFWVDPVTPPLGTTFFYLVRAAAPHVGSWGLKSNGQERTGFINPETICNDAADNDGDGLIDCGDPDCALAPNCPPATFTFTDTAGDDIADNSLAAFFSSVSPGPADFLYVALEGAGLTDIRICAERADFYRDNYLALAATDGLVSSGGWNRWTLLEGGSWTGPDTGSYENAFGESCLGSHSWCPERNLAGREIAVLPGQPDQCETVDFVSGCGPGSWQLTIRLGSSRFATCGF